MGTHEDGGKAHDEEEVYQCVCVEGKVSVCVGGSVETQRELLVLRGGEHKRNGIIM